MKDKRINPNSIVFMHYTLRLEDGSVADSSLDAGQPVQFVMGEEYISEAFEAALLGLRVNDKKHVHLAAKDAFGEVDEIKIANLPITQFSNFDELEVDTVMEFTNPNGGVSLGIIRRVMDNLVTVDFNHPLAGHDVDFDVQIVDIQSPEGE